MKSWIRCSLSFRSSMSFVLWMSMMTIAFAQTQTDPMTIRYNGKEFVHRWSKDNQHEFTPTGQEDLASWTDMLTLVAYHDVYDGQDLAAVSNKVLSDSKSRGKILKTDSRRRTLQRPAEHLIIAVLLDPMFLEAVFARLKSRWTMKASPSSPHTVSTVLGSPHGARPAVCRPGPSPLWGSGQVRWTLLGGDQRRR